MLLNTVLRIHIDFNADLDPDPAFNVKSDRKYPDPEEIKSMRIRIRNIAYLSSQSQVGNPARPSICQQEEEQESE
jgi:hypothetical protein